MKQFLKSSAVIAALALAGLVPAAQAQSIALSDSDIRLQDEVKSALLSDKRLNGAIFTVSALNGRVSVVGTLRDQTQASPAFRVARNVAGVSSVTTFLDAPTG